MDHWHGKIIFVLSLVLASLLILTSSIGLFTKDFYSTETLNWQAQSVGQDMIDLFLITPVLIFTSILAYSNYRFGSVLWAGAILYIFYTYLIFCFDVHFNKLFVAYTIVLGLSAYLFLYFLLSIPKEKTISSTPFSRAIGIYFLILSPAFYLLWLSEILPSIVYQTAPKTLSESGLITNPVHVIDLSLFLPGIFITGVLVLRKKAIGLILAPSFLVFFILMDITIGWLVIVMKNKGLQTDLSVTVGMTVLALISLVLLIGYLKHSTKNNLV